MWATSVDVNEILDNISRAVNNVPDQHFYNSQKSFHFYTQKLRAFFERFKKKLMYFSNELEEKRIIYLFKHKNKTIYEKIYYSSYLYSWPISKKQKNLFFFPSLSRLFSLKTNSQLCSVWPHVIRSVTGIPVSYA